MRLYSMGQLSNEEKSNILDKHREVYNGYRRMQNEVPKEQPLYVQDFAGDKDGITINNKGEVKKYTNFGINEQWQALAADALAAELGGAELAPLIAPSIEQGISNIGDKISDFTSGFSSPTVSSEEMEEGECYECGEEMEEQEINQFESDMMEGECSECGGVMMEGECSECGWKGEMEEGIHDVEDLNLSDKFDYVEGVNDEDLALALDTKDPNLALAMSENEIRIYETMTSAFEEELDEYTGPGPLYSKVEPAYDFESDGPLQAKGPYHQNEEELDELSPKDLVKGKKYKYSSPSFEDEIEFEDEYPTEGMYGFKGKKMGHAMGGKHIEDFVSDIDLEDLEDYGETDTASKRMKRGMGDVEDTDWEEIDEELRESLISQKNKINEMFNRMNKYN